MELEEALLAPEARENAVQPVQDRAQIVVAAHVVVALITFAPEKRFLEAAQELRIPVELDPDAARLAGIAYANYVLSPKK